MEESPSQFQYDDMIIFLVSYFPQVKLFLSLFVSLIIHYPQLLFIMISLDSLYCTFLKFALFSIKQIKWIYSQTFFISFNTHTHSCMLVGETNLGRGMTDLTHSERVEEWNYQPLPCIAQAKSDLLRDESRMKNDAFSRIGSLILILTVLLQEVMLPSSRTGMKGTKIIYRWQVQNEILYGKQT